MNVNTVLQTGIQGVQRGQEGLQKAASEIVNAGTISPTEGQANAQGNSQSSSVIEPIVDLKLYEQTVEASAKVVETADEVLGTLLDTLA